MRAFAALVVLVVACSTARRPPGAGDDASTGDDDAMGGGDGECELFCSVDLHAVLDCHGREVMRCAGTDSCSTQTKTCVSACVAAEMNHSSVGCDYFAMDMDTTQPNGCFAAFVANTWTTAAHLTVELRGAQLPVAAFTRVPMGAGAAITYGAYDPVAGLAPGQVAVLFLSGTGTGSVACPFAPADAAGSATGTGIRDAYRIQTDVPVVAYQMNPFGGGAVAITGASLLLPASAWDKEYVAVNVGPLAAGKPSLDIIAREDGTVATLVPNVAIVGGTGIPATAAGQPLAITLDKGQVAQITQDAEVTGSVLTSNKPIGFLAGHTCMNVPFPLTPFCDHGEQMIPPVKALGHRHVGVMYRGRTPAETATTWRLVGAVDGTTLTWSAQVGGPATLQRGQSVTFDTGTPFLVESQDKDHPFLLFTYMKSSSVFTATVGDPDFVLGVPPEQYLQQYVFFTDPTYPETNLVVVRKRGKDGAFHDVTLDCAGALGGWQTITNDFQLARADLMTGNFVPVGNCSTGRREMKSDAPFGLWVWGWGAQGTVPNSPNISYGYPAGMNVQPINDVVIN